MKYAPNPWETCIVEHDGLQLIERREPHTYYDIYWLGMWIFGTASVDAAWLAYVARLS